MTQQRTFWTLVISAASILGLTMGIRQSMGLFLSPLNTSTGLGIVTISLAMAIAQFTWGLAQPLFGMLADRVGSYKIIVFGTLLFALGLFITPYMSSGFGLIFAVGLLTTVGDGAGSYSILIGAVAQKVTLERRSTAAGLINAGGSLGQFIYAPITQALISSFKWVIAIFVLTTTSLTTILLALPLRDKKEEAEKQVISKAGEMSLGEQLRIAFKNRSYFLNIGFFTCGFHIAFLVTHLPRVVNLCGLPASVGATSLAIIGLANVIESITAGWLGQTKRMKMILFWMYASRAIAISIYLISTQITANFLYFLSCAWLYVACNDTSYSRSSRQIIWGALSRNIALLSHQIGDFFVAWLGGITFRLSESYELMWYADIALALLAALVNLPIKGQHPKFSNLTV